MFIRKNFLLLALAAPSASAFVSRPSPSAEVGCSILGQKISLLPTRMSSTAAAAVTTEAVDASLANDIRRAVQYKAGAAKTTFAQRFESSKGQNVRTVGEAFAQFTQELGVSINPLYKSMITDLVGTTHLIVVNARFQRDPIWSLGLLSATELLLQNYPEPDVAARIVSALLRSVGLDEQEIRAEAAQVTEWLLSMNSDDDSSSFTKADVEAALRGEGDSVVAKAAAAGWRGDDDQQEFWMYSRYFGIGLLQMMQAVDVPMDKDEVYPVMEDWLSNQMGRSHLTACADSDMYFRIKEKLDIMETMMKEIEIREKKRMAERLEDKAEAAIRAAEREDKFQKEIAAEATAAVQA